MILFSVCAVLYGSADLQMTICNERNYRDEKASVVEVTSPALATNQGNR